MLAAGSEKEAAHRLGLSHSTVKHHLANARSKVGAANTAQLVWILAPRLPEPGGMAQTGAWRNTRLVLDAETQAVAPGSPRAFGQPGQATCRIGCPGRP